MTYKEITYAEYERLQDKSGAYEVFSDHYLGLSWYLNGELHRIEGPAIIWAGGWYEWHKNGKHHRTDGPAIKIANGEIAWALDGVEYSKEEWFLLLTPEQRAIALSNPENF